MLYIISKEVEIKNLYLIKAPNTEEAYRLVGVKEEPLKTCMITDIEVKVLANNDYCLLIT